MAGRIVPETANRPDWPRLVAQGHRDSQNRLKALETALAAAEAAIAALETDLVPGHPVNARINALDSRIDALEAPSTLTLTPGSAPGSPTEGMIYYDDTANKLKCWDGAAWNDLW